MVAIHTTDKDTALSSAMLSNLDGMGLPADYTSLNPVNRKRARLTSLRSWFSPDPALAYILCNDVEKFIKAHRLWVTCYLKPDPHNAHVYHFRDPEHKYEMVRAAMAPAMKERQPAKCAIHAPRGSTKTITLITERYTLIAWTSRYVGASPNWCSSTR